MADIKRYRRSELTEVKVVKKTAKPKKKYKIVIALLIIAGVLGAFLLFGYLTNRVIKSAPGQVGNTAGNLYNGGLFCENDGRIYFSNPNDDYALYSMSDDLTDYKKLYNDYARYINVDENYVYYTRMNNKKEKATQSIFIFYNTGVYRLTKSGKYLKAVTSDPSGSLLLYDNKLYYQKIKNNALTLFRTDIDGKNEIKVFSDDTPVTSAYDGKVYYSGKLEDQNVHFIMQSGSVALAFETKAYMPIATEEGLFYVSTENGYRIVRSDLDGKNNRVIVDRPVSWYNITPDLRYVFYQCEETNNKALYVLDRESSITRRIAEGNYKWINIAGPYCFFFDFNEEHTYIYDYEAGQLGEFSPPSNK